MTRKPPSHKISELGEDQLREFIHSLGWEIDPLTDYGEDFMVRVADNGEFPGYQFFVQLKSTENLDSYRLKKDKSFSYPISPENLNQWYVAQIPVLLILWDINERTGYWLHIQPYITEKLRKHPNWLDGNKNRKVHLQDSRSIRLGETNNFQKDIDQIFEQLSMGQYLGLINKISDSVFLQQQLAAFEAMTDEDSENPFLWAGKATIFYKLHQMNMAYQSIEKAWSLNNTDLSIRYNRACILSEFAEDNSGYPKWMLHEALAEFEALSKNDPTANTYYNIGTTLSCLRKYEEAIEEYDKALKLGPSDELASQIWTNRGIAYGHLGNEDEERSSYKNAIALNPALWQPHASLALSRVRKEEYNEAIPHFEACIAIKPALQASDLKLTYFYARALFELEHFEEAYKQVNYASRIEPANPDVRKLKGLILIPLWRNKVVDASEAIRFHEFWLLDEPNEALAKSELHLLYLAREDRETARKYIEEAVQSSDVPAQVFYDYAIFLEEEGEIESAIHQLEKAYAINPEHHIVHKLANVKKDLGLYAEAIEYYKQILEGDEHHTQVLAQIGECYFEQGNHRESAIVCCYLLQIDPFNKYWRQNLSTNLQILGEEQLFSHLANTKSEDEVVEATEKIVTYLDTAFDK